MGHLYPFLYQSNLCTLQFPYSTSILQLKKCSSSILDMGSWSSFFSMFSLNLVLLCSDIFSMYFGIYCRQWLTYLSVKLMTLQDLLAVKEFRFGQYYSWWIWISYFKNSQFATFLLCHDRASPGVILRSCDRFFATFLLCHDRASLGVILRSCDRWEFNFTIEPVVEPASLLLNSRSPWKALRRFSLTRLKF